MHAESEGGGVSKGLVGDRSVGYPNPRNPPKSSSDPGGEQLAVHLVLGDLLKMTPTCRALYCEIHAGKKLQHR